MLRIDTSPLSAFLEDGALDAYWAEVEAAHHTLIEGTGAGSDYLGWRDLLLDPNDALLSDVEATAASIRENGDVLLCIGIGGSYLGAQAVIQALTPYFGGSGPEVLFAGHHISGAYLRQLLASLEGKSVYVNVISKSGTTLEPALAFRFVRDWMEEHFDDADQRIIVTTDPDKGALNQLREEHPYKKYVIPPSVGGRFSVLTPVGLLPIAVAGIDIRTLFYGAVEACKRYATASRDHAALEYAAVRALLLDQGFGVETLAVFEPSLRDFGSWWQQLYGESEGKEHTGLFPVVVQYSTDLHSLGQYMQEGQRIMIETFLMLEEDGGSQMTVRKDADNLDGLNYLEGKSMTEVKRKAYEGTLKAHTDGGVPAMTIWLGRLDAQTLGECIYFFEHAVAVSGYLIGVNPFDQPGVEAYKKEMFRRLGKTSG
ncbi:MAG: glucose-6-phosphate isomerase [Bacteroidota bacterium]